MTFVNLGTESKAGCRRNRKGTCFTECKNLSFPTAGMKEGPNTWRQRVTRGAKLKEMLALGAAGVQGKHLRANASLHLAPQAPGLPHLNPVFNREGNEI